MAPRSKKETDALAAQADAAVSNPNSPLLRAAVAMDKVLKTSDWRVNLNKDSFAEALPHIPSGSIVIDYLIGGNPNKFGVRTCPGLPRGRITQVYGVESCLAGDTQVSYQVRSPDGKCQNSKGGTLQNLWHRFHGQPQKGKGFYQRKATEGAVFYAPSINEDGRVFQNMIVDVVATGEKEVLAVKTASGLSIEATRDHRFFTGERYLPLSELSVGATVYVHNGTRYEVAEYAKAPQRKFLYVRNHPVAGVKSVEGGYTYHRLARSRAIIEAELNGLSLDDYVSCLNAGTLEGLLFLARDMHVHHLDENVTNDERSNLVLLDPSEHGRQHAVERHNNLRFAAVADTIVSIEVVGVKPTYDIKMLAPFNNYVANGFVVHNCGKTTLALTLAASVCKQGGTVVFIDYENAISIAYAAALGVPVADKSRFMLAQPDTLEDGFKIIYAMASAGVDLIVIDSIGAAIPKDVAEISLDEMGKQQRVGLLAQKWSQFLPLMRSCLKKTGAACFAIAQIRDAINTMGHGDSTTVQGGRAWKFYPDLRLKLARIQQETSKQYNAVTHAVEDQKTSGKIKVTIEKCKISDAQGKEGIFYIRYGSGIDDLRSLIEIGIAHGVIKKGGAWYVWTRPDGSEIKTQGLDKLGAEIRKINAVPELEHAVTAFLSGVKVDIAEDDDEDDSDDLLNGMNF
jgi:protein RecA